MTADQVINALMDYIRSSDSAIMGSKGPRKQALTKALDAYIDQRIAEAIQRVSRTVSKP